MDDAGFILTCYVVAFGGMAAYAWRILRRARDLADQVPEEDRPWT